MLPTRGGVGSGGICAVAAGACSGRCRASAVPWPRAASADVLGQLPHEPLFCIGAREVKGCFPTSLSSL
jgi:hypothetical protein